MGFAASIFGLFGILVATAAPAETQAMSLVGTYSLPTAASLQEFSSYPMPTATWTVENNRVKFVYELPEDVTGTTGETMTMVGSVSSLDSEFFSLMCFATGTTASCSMQGDRLGCVLRFRNLGLEKAVVDQFLERKYGASLETDLRKDAAAHIREANAVGVIALTPVAP